MLLLALIYNLFASFASILMICEIGENINKSFNEITSAINKLNWHLFPIEAKKMLPMIMIVAQKPVVFKGFGSTACVRETFKQVKY